MCSSRMGQQSQSKATIGPQISDLRSGFRRKQTAKIRLFFAYTESMTTQEVRHRVYLSFQCRYGWHCQFQEQDLKTPLPRKLHFKSSEKVVELVERGGGLKDPESRLMLDQAVVTGRGGGEKGCCRSIRKVACTYAAFESWRTPVWHRFILRVQPALSIPNRCRLVWLL